MGDITSFWLGALYSLAVGSSQGCCGAVYVFEGGHSPR